MTTATKTKPNGYADEHAVRAEVFHAARRNGLAIEKYAMADKQTDDGDLRTVAVSLRLGLDRHPELYGDIAAAFQEHGYRLDDFVVTAKAIKNIGDQLLFDLAGYGDAS